MSKGFKEDLTGKRFGRLTVIEFVPNEKPRTFWKCKCDCGNVSVVCATDLKRWDVLSCGCWIKEKRRERFLKHGLSHTRIYRIWKSMISRCFFSSSKDYKNYGGRGITVCDEWKNNVTAFYEWAMENGYTDELTIDRIDPNKDYCPENCRWIPLEYQNRNKRNTVFVSYQGKLMSLSEASELSGIKYVTLFRRYSAGERNSQLFRPVKRK